MAEPSPAPGFPRRPLPIGAFELPFGYLLLPPGAPTDVAEVLLRGQLPGEWPAPLRGFGHCLAGDFDGALAAFAGDGPVDRYNRFVIDPAGVDVARLRADLEAMAEGLGLLVDLVLFTLGRSDTPPPVPADDLRALVLAAHAAAAAVADPDAAVKLLESAVEAVPARHPALAGVMLGGLAHLQQLAGRPDAAIGSLTDGIARLTGTDLSVACAEQHLALAAILHERAGGQPAQLQRAVHHYHCALQTITEERAPELFAGAHAGLATAYLTMPMTQASDRLRYGVAVGSLRAALRVYTPDHHPGEWASAQLNLANALVYAPSTHQNDNLMEAVELYEAVLRARTRHQDPLGRARVLANQGNALAHLGELEHAWTKLAEARGLFEEFHDDDAATTVQGVLDEIARVRSVDEPVGGAR